MGGVIGDGRNPCPWIHLEDTVRAIEHVIHTESIQGPVNVTASGSVHDTAATLNCTLSKVLKRPAVLRVPKCLVHFSLGSDRADVFFSQAVVKPDKLQSTAFTFHFDNLHDCISNLVS